MRGALLKVSGCQSTLQHRVGAGYQPALAALKGRPYVEHVATVHCSRGSPTMPRITRFSYFSLLTSHF
jgi:hypothetical protein